MAGDNKVKVFITGVDEFSATFSKFQHGLGDLKENLMHLVEAAGVATFGEFIHSTSEAIENMGRLSEKTGVAVEDLSALSFAAKMSDVPFETLAKGIEKLSKAMLGLEDSPGGNAASKALHNLGVEVKNADGSLRSASDVFKDIATKFSLMQDGAEKTGLAMQIFGKSGAELIPILNQGATGIDELMAKAKELGVVLSKDDVEAAQQFNDTIKIAESLVKGMGFQFVEGLLPALTAAVKSLGDTSAAFGMAKSAGQQLGDLVKLIALTFLDLGYSLDLAIIKLQRFAPLLEALSNPRAPGALSSALEAFTAKGKDTDAQIQALNSHFLQLWDTLSNPAKSSKGEGPEKTFSTLTAKIKEAEQEISQFEKMWNDLSAIGDGTNDVLRKVESHRSELATLDKDLEMLRARLAALQEFLSSHPGEFFPEVAKQAEDVKAKIEELEKEREKLETPPNIPQMPGGMTPQDIPINVPNGPLEQQAERMKKIHDLWKQLGTDVLDQVKQAALFGRSWGDVLKALIVDVGIAIVKFEILKHTQQASTTQSGGGTSIFGSILGAIFGKHASGGGVQAGMPVIVGDNGPEIFTSPVSGSIVPNYMLSGAGAAGLGKLDVVLHVTSDVDLKIQKAMVRAANAGAMQAVNVIQERKLRTT